MTSVADAFPPRNASDPSESGPHDVAAYTSPCLRVRARLPLTDSDGKLLPAWERKSLPVRRAAWHVREIEKAETVPARVHVVWGWIRSELKQLPAGSGPRGWALVLERLLEAREEMARMFPGAVATMEEALDDDE